METEYLAIIITISVLGGVVFVAFLSVCITKIAADRSLKKSLAKSRLFGGTVPQSHSYVRYNDPEPQTPVGLAPDNPWESNYPGYHTNPALEDFTPDPLTDLSMLHVPPPDLSRRPSITQYRPPSVLPSRQSSYVQDLPRRPSYSQEMQRRPSNAQGMPRTRYSYAPDLDRGPSYAVQRSSSMVSQIRPRPPGGENKLWYNYIKNDPDYFTSESLEWNKMQPRVWQGRSRGVPPPAPHQDYHRQAASRLSWI
ncbi:uncharacterized protein LOC123501570 [Portunus trituberculatus]|uniref:uncharacterized protein LOC123501570 n=1 Tax=Portunus trituberculatus TaxID=210409 RepID=UPI001E1D0F38|nr:uncharacterized protein LOC123501570 [Portunus trituberculatus]XP_045106405.1 uncharacterized protein LOC123501570 [Portunus trituberculatus]